MFLKKEIFFYVSIILSFSINGCSSSKKPSLTEKQAKSNKKISIVDSRNSKTKNQNKELNTKSSTVST